jgi:hypothetical protein
MNEEGKLSLNIDDQKWIKLLFDRQDEVIERQFTELNAEIARQHAVEIETITENLYVKVAEVIKEQNDRMFEALSKQNEAIAGIQTDVTEIRREMKALKSEMDQVEIDVKSESDRIAVLEKRVSRENLLIYILIAVVLSVGASLGLFYYFLKRCIS